MALLAFSPLHATVTQERVLASTINDEYGKVPQFSNRNERMLLEELVHFSVSKFLPTIFSINLTCVQNVCGNKEIQNNSSDDTFLFLREIKDGDLCYTEAAAD